MDPSRQAATNANVAAVADLIKQNARFTVKEIADGVGVSSGTAQRALILELKVRKSEMAASMDWYWTDLICPRNYKRRKSIMLATTKLITVLEADFRKANELIDCFHENLPGVAFNHVSLNRQMKLEDNCKALAGILFLLLGHLNGSHDRLKNLMEEELFTELMATQTSFVNKIKAARKASKDAIAAVGSVPGMVVISQMSEQDYIQVLIDRVNAVSRCAFAWMTLDDLYESPDDIITRMNRAQNGSTIDENITDLEVNLQQFDQASYDFGRAVDRVIVRIDG